MLVKPSLYNLQIGSEIVEYSAYWCDVEVKIDRRLNYALKHHIEKFSWSVYSHLCIEDENNTNNKRC